MKAVAVSLMLLVASVAAAPGVAPLHAVPANFDPCGACKFAVHVLSDMLCDPYVDDQIVSWAEANICSQMSDHAQCADLVKGLTPALVQWLRANASPESMCGDARVCGAPSLPDMARAQELRAPRPASRPNDMTCPLCMFVAGFVKQQVNDPATQASIHDASIAACATLPAGVMQEACTGFVEQYEMTLVKYVATMEPSEVCMLMGTCLDQAVVRAGRLHPLSAGAVRALEPAAAAAVAQAQAGRAGSNADHCEVCKAVVLEMHQLVANPDLQNQVVDYAKQACSMVPSLAATCQADVDQYAPMLFGMVLAYLQPEQVCTQLKMCPPPSWLQAQGSLLAAKFGGRRSAIRLGLAAAA